jgi:hypothetical protein
MADRYDFSLRHSKTPFSELNSEDKRTVLKSGDSRGKTSDGIVPDNTVRSSEKPYVRNRTYLAAQSTQEQNISLHLGGELPGIDYKQNKSPPLLVQCDDCRGCGQLTNGHPNDPWARSWCCSMCDGTGQVIAGCECCREDATERFDGLMLCAAHAAEQKADAEAVA